MSTLLFFSAAVNSDWFQILLSYTPLHKLPVLMCSCCACILYKLIESTSYFLVSVPGPKPTPARITFSIPACYTGSDIHTG